MRTCPPAAWIGSWAEQAVAERLLGTVPAGESHGVRGERPGHLRREDVALVLDVDRDVGERLLGHAEVLGQHVAGGVREPVGDQERLVLGEVAVVEDEQELAALLQPLDRVRDPGREVPEVARADVVDEVAALLRRSAVMRARPASM